MTLSEVKARAGAHRPAILRQSDLGCQELAPACRSDRTIKVESRAAFFNLEAPNRAKFGRLAQSQVMGAS
jgi:hypothetical protein